MKRKLLQRLRMFFANGKNEAEEIRIARELIAAIDAGGIPLNPQRVNVVARGLGLEVSRRAPVEETIRRIRAALLRV